MTTWTASVSWSHKDSLLTYRSALLFGLLDLSAFLSGVVVVVFIMYCKSDDNLLTSDVICCYFLIFWAFESRKKSSNQHSFWYMNQCLAWCIYLTLDFGGQQPGASTSQTHHKLICFAFPCWIFDNANEFPLPCPHSEGTIWTDWWAFGWAWWNPKWHTIILIDERGMGFAMVHTHLRGGGGGGGVLGVGFVHWTTLIVIGVWIEGWIRGLNSSIQFYLNPFGLPSSSTHSRSSWSKD